MLFQIGCDFDEVLHTSPCKPIKNSDDDKTGEMATSEEGISQHALLIFSSSIFSYLCSINGLRINIIIPEKTHAKQQTTMCTSIGVDSSFSKVNTSNDRYLLAVADAMEKEQKCMGFSQTETSDNDRYIYGVAEKWEKQQSPSCFSQIGTSKNDRYLYNVAENWEQNQNSRRESANEK